MNIAEKGSMADRPTRQAEDDEEKALGELLAADHLLDVIVAHEREGHAAEASDDEAGDDKNITGGA